MPHLDPVASRTDRVSRRWRIAVGMLLALPGVALAQAPSTPQTHSVRPGDTLWSLAERRLPEPAGARQVTAGWHAIYRRNRGVIGPDPDLIRPGQVLVLTRETT
jgi:nucleoid-associated protein YgaU